MNPPLKAVPIATPRAEPPVDAPIGRPFLWLLLLLSNRVAVLEAENARLLRAVQRESHHIDQRAPHSGRK